MRWILLVALLTWAPVSDAAERRTFPEQGIQTFLGLDDTSAPTQVGDGRAQDIQNVKLSVSKDMRQRFGVSTVLTSSDVNGLVIGDILDIQEEGYCAVNGVYYTKFSSGTEVIIATCGGRLYQLDGTTEWDQVIPNGIPFSSGTGQNDQFTFTVALDNIILTNDADPPHQYNGTTLTPIDFSGLSVDSPPTKAKTVAFFKNFLIFGNTVEGGTEFPTRFRYSNVGTINTYSDGDFIDIGALGGQEINCMAELYDTLIVGLTDSLYKISLVGGADVFQVSKITDDIGCIAKNSIQSITLTNAQSGLIFLDKDKRIYFYNGVIAQDISRLITTVMGGLSGSRLEFAISADTNTDYWLCVTDGTGSTHNLCLDFQYEIGEWTKHTNIPANAMAPVIDNNSDFQVYWGSYKSFIYNLEDTDNRDDVATGSGTVDSVGVHPNRISVSDAQVLFDDSQTFETGILVGAPISLVGGTGSGQSGTILDNTATGIIVTDAFSTTPDNTTAFEIGAIDSFYLTKWYDYGDPARLKDFLEIYFWAEADVSSTHSLSYATDFGTDVETLAVSLSASETDAIWGSAIWGTAIWGDVDDIFRDNPLQSTNGRFLRMRWAEDDPEELFHIYGFNVIFDPGRVD